MSDWQDSLAVANLVFTAVTTICALYLAGAALKHGARPHINVQFLSPGPHPCDTEVVFRFGLTNVGHWYGRPMAINTTVFCNFSPQFRLLELKYGSTQAYNDLDFKTGVGGLVYLKAKGLKLTHGEEAEEIHVRAITPPVPGEFLVRISAYSENGASLMREFSTRCDARPVIAFDPIDSVPS